MSEVLIKNQLQLSVVCMQNKILPDIFHSEHLRQFYTEKKIFVELSKILKLDNPI